MGLCVYSLAPHHSFGLPSLASGFMSINTPVDLKAQLGELDDVTFYILGEGSNTIFLENYQGTIIKPAFMGIDLKHTDTYFLLKVGASENWHHLVLWCMQHNIDGFENLALIPGTVGAAPIQNIGAYGVEIEKFIHHVEYYDLNTDRHLSIDSTDCEFTYRSSVFKKRLSDNVIITSVTFGIPKDWRPITNYGELKGLLKPSAMDIFNKVVDVRIQKLPDPAKIGNAGSFFKNPIITLKQYNRLQQLWPSIPSYAFDNVNVKIPAAWLIDQLGFKGKKIGGIGCHPHQALVLTNDGSGTGEQLLQLARAIKASVLREFTIELENEVRLIGKKGPIVL